MQLCHLQRDAGRLEKWAERNIDKFSMGYCKALHLRRANPTHQNMMGADAWEAASCPDGQQDGHNLANHPHTKRFREVFFHLCLALVSNSHTSVCNSCLPPVINT